jgi:hypothetical protein
MESVAPYWAVGVGAYLFLCAIAGGYCSVQKGRNALEGFLLGLIFGPFGIVAAACLPDERKMPPPRA